MSGPSHAARVSNVDVLIIGAGPAGVMCANALAHAGINMRIVDKRPEGLVAGQADGIQPRTIEILQSYGLSDRLYKEGNRIWRSAYYNSDGRGGIARTSLSGYLTGHNARYPIGITLHQGGVEDIFLDSMKKRGLVVERATVPVSLSLSESLDELKDPQAYAATVVLKHLDTQVQETVHAKYVVGTDGAHSWVRKTLGIRAEGSSSMWGVLDIVPETDFPDIRNITYIHSDHGTMFIVPREHGLVRLYVQQPDDCNAIDPDTGRPDKSKFSPEKILQQVQKKVHPYRIEMKDGRAHWWTVYVVGQRVAETYSIHDRLIIAGDACHTHSPKAGQGMNAALGDSHNLAWKLAYVLKGWGDLSLLRTYESERRKFAQDLIEFDKQYSRLFIGTPQSEDSPNGRNDDSEQLAKMAKTFGGFTSGVGIHYDPSSIVNPQYQTLAPGLVVGDRIPPQMFIDAASGEPIEIHDILPSNTRFKILVFGGDITIPGDAARLASVAEAMKKPDSFLHRFGHGNYIEILDVLCFSESKQEDTNYLHFPQFFREHWSRVLLDDTDIFGRTGGSGYATYGIDPRVGTIVVVRPDGHVGFVAPLDRVDEVTAYFRSFML